MKRFFLIFFIFSIVSLFADNKVLDHINANNDHGFWLENRIFKRISKEWSTAFHANFRWGSDYRKLWYQEYVAILQYNLTPWLGCCPSSIKKLTIGPGYSEGYEIKKNTLGAFQHVYINKPFIEANFILKFISGSIFNRFRYEYHKHCKSHFKNFSNIRFRMDWFPPITFTSWKITPYCSNEFFFRKNSYSNSNPTGLVGGFYQNRFRAGFAGKFFDDTFLPMAFWQWRSERKHPGINPRWFNTYAYGLTLRLKF